MYFSSGCSIRTKKINGVEHLEYEISNRLSIKGSHDANITIRSHTDSTIEISGNPAKFYRVIIFLEQAILYI